MEIERKFQKETFNRADEIYKLDSGELLRINGTHSGWQLNNGVPKAKLVDEIPEGFEKAEIQSMNEEKMIEKIYQNLKEEKKMIVKKSEIKENVEKLIEKKGWNLLRVWQQSLEGVTPEADKTIMKFKSKKFDTFFEGFEIAAKEGKEFGRKDEEKFEIKFDKDKNIIRIISREKNTETSISPFNNREGKRR